MKFGIRMFCLALITVFMLGLTACGEEGSAEKAGKKIDNAMEQLKQDAQDAGEKLSDDYEAAKEKAKKAME